MGGIERRPYQRKSCTRALKAEIRNEGFCGNSGGSGFLFEARAGRTKNTVAHLRINKMSYVSLEERGQKPLVIWLWSATGLRPAPSATVNVMLGFDSSKCPALYTILDFVHFEHPLVLAKLGLTLSMIAAIGPG